MKSFFTTSIIAASLFVIGLSAQTAPAPVPAPAPKGKIAQRKVNQQDRIAQGVKSGQMTAGETARVEKKESRLNKETRTARAANGGKLTPAEKKQVNRQQNTLSRDIYKDKHNGAVQP